MKKILFSIFCLCILIFCADRFYYYGFIWNKDLKSEYVSNTKINSSIIFHGPCEAEWGIDPTIIDSITKFNSYTLALNHSDFADNYLHLYLYIKNKNIPKYVFLYVTPDSMDSTRSNTFNTYRFIPFLNDPIVYDVVKDLDKDYLKYAKIPLLRYTYYSNFTLYKAINGWKHKLTNRTNPEHPNGYLPASNSFQSAFLNYKLLHPKVFNFLWSSKREKYLRKCIELCKENNINIYLYESPVFEESKMYNLNRDEFLLKIESLSKNYNIPFIRFDNLSMSTFSKNYFNALNTTIEGTNTFSQIFGNFIKNEIVNKK